MQVETSSPHEYVQRMKDSENNIEGLRTWTLIIFLKTIGMIRVKDYDEWNLLYYEMVGKKEEKEEG